MPHAYIDESGTRHDQEVMTVSMIVVEGAFTAQAIHKVVLEEINPKWGKRTNSRQRLVAKLHYVDMTKDHKMMMGSILAQRGIDCFASCYYHEGDEKPHEERFGAYLQCVKNCLWQAFDIYDDLTVTIEKQGGWADYKGPMISALGEIPEEYTKRGRFTKSKFELQSSSKHGLQLADFYAGAIRDHLLSHKDKSLSVSYDHISHQIRDIKVETYENAAKTKG
ncbi:MAG: DUF3800 domain-containing protein [Candidatus Obscuribacterales bacterium]|nr:DUF3800 domain-containing protein [Candidatus Obscuribacterales bacterium]